MNSKSSKPGDAEAIRRLLAESGVEETGELSGALADLRAESRTSAPDPGPELEAFFTAGVTPLSRPSRRRGFLLGGAIVAAMAAGTTGVAAANGGLWIKAEDTHEAPASVNFEQVPAPTPAPAETSPAAVPSVLPASPGETKPEPAEEEPPAAETVPADAGEPGDGSAEPGLGSGPGADRGEQPGRGPDHDVPGREAPGRDIPGRDGPDNAGRAGGNSGNGNNGYGHGRDNSPGRVDSGKDNSGGRDNNGGKDSHGKGNNGREDHPGGPQHGNGRSSG